MALGDLMTRTSQVNSNQSRSDRGIQGNISFVELLGRGTNCSLRLAITAFSHRILYIAVEKYKVLSHTVFARQKSSVLQHSPPIALQCLRCICSPRFLAHECAAHSPLAPATRGAISAESARTTHALHTSLAGVVEPSKSQVVHEEHDGLVFDECLDLDTAQTTEVLGELHMLKRAVIEVRTRRHLDLGVVSFNIVTGIGIPGRASDVEDAGIRAIVVAAEPYIGGVEPESRQAVVRTIGDVTRLGTRDNSRHAWLVPSGTICSIASSGCQEDSELITRVGCERLLVIWCVNVSVAKGKMVVRTEDRRRLRDVSIS